MTNIDEKIREDFYAQLELSSTTLSNYKWALKSKMLTEVLAEMDQSIHSIFEITDLNKLWDIYTQINVHPSNIKKHRVVSCAIMSYIRFLNNGNKIGKRIDFGIKRERGRVASSSIKTNSLNSKYTT